jgi:diacylglycerol kinase (ATP)
MAKMCFILNPAAGSVTDRNALAERIVSLPDADLKITAKRGEAERFARSAARAGCDLIVAAGGDGTLNEVVNGIGEKTHQARIGLLPLGTGNDFARSLALPTDLDAALEVLRTGRARAVDLVRVTSDRVRHFVNVSAGGFSAVVDEKLTPEIKETWGPLAYARSAAAALPELRAYRTNVSLDNEECVSMNLYNVVIANGRYVAGGTPIAPQAEIDDGLLDVILLAESSPSRLALLMPQILVGSHLSSDAVVFKRAAKVGVNSRPGMWFNVDGELVGNEPATIEVLPRALQFIVP